MMVIPGKRCLCSIFLFLSLAIFSSLSNGLFSFQGAFLVGHAFKTFPVTEWYECLRECASLKNCASYNLRMATTLGAGLTCELNDCGFENKCQAGQKLIQAYGYIFHQLKMTKYCQKKIDGKVPSSHDYIKLAVSCSQRVRVYVDGELLTDNIVFCWTNSTLEFKIPSNARLLALEGFDDNRGQPGLIASLSNDVITDDSWKCTESLYPEWMKLTLDDSKWPHAIVYGNNSIPVWPLRVARGISTSAKWIWSDKAEATRHVCCRKWLLDLVKLTQDGELRDVLPHDMV